jgi:hypothetical protein
MDYEKIVYGAEPILTQVTWKHNALGVLRKHESNTNQPSGLAPTLIINLFPRKIL